MSRIRSLVFGVASLACLAPATVAGAQAIPAVAVGERVRVGSGRSGSEEGTFQALRGDSLELGSPDGTVRRLALTDIARLEVGRGTRTRERDFVVSGLVGGAVIGGYLGAQAIQRQNSQRNGFPALGSPTGGGIAGALLGALGGAIVGDLVGRQLRTVRWELVNARDLGAH